MAHLQKPADIRAAGANAVQDWDLTDRQVEQVVALLMPVRDKATKTDTAARRGAA